MEPTTGEIRALSLRFNVRTEAVTRLRDGVYRIQDRDKKPYALKRMPIDALQLRWIDATLVEMRNVGFTGLAWRDPGHAGGDIPFVRDERGRRWILTPWIEGRPPDPRRIDAMSRCAVELAHFHRVGRTVVKRGGSTPARVDHLGTWQVLAANCEWRLERQIRHVASLGPPLTAALLRARADELTAQAQRARRLLQGASYRSLCRDAQKSGSLCHGDCGGGNFLITSAGVILIDFETLRQDLRVFDLFRLLRLTGKQNGWDSEIAAAILQAYGETDEALRPEEWSLLEGWLRLPLKAVRLLTRTNHPTAKDDALLSHRLKQALADTALVDRMLPELRERIGGCRS